MSELISSWAAGTPRVRRVWLSEMLSDGASIGIMVELQPVGDSEETMAVWMAHCDGWLAELKARIGEPVDLDWYDPDTETPSPPATHDGKTLVYERTR